MKKIIALSLFLLLFSFLDFRVVAQEDTPLSDGAEDPGPTRLTPITTTTQQTQTTNNLCVKVGNPSDPAPATCNLPTTSLTAVKAPGGGAGQFVHYCQNNTPAWPTSNGCTLAASGCGPTSIAMVMSTFNRICDGSTCTPAAVNRYMEAAGQRGPSCMSVVNGGALVSSWFRNAGMQTGPAVGGRGADGFDFLAAKAAIDKGFLIIGSATNAPSCNCNHIFVIQDVDPVNRTIHVRDPICSGNNQEKNFDDLYNNAIRNRTLDWLYAIPIIGTPQVEGVQ